MPPFDGGPLLPGHVAPGPASAGTAPPAPEPLFYAADPSAGAEAASVVAPPEIPGGYTVASLATEILSAAPAAEVAAEDASADPPITEDVTIVARHRRRGFRLR